MSPDSHSIPLIIPSSEILYIKYAWKSNWGKTVFASFGFVWQLASQVGTFYRFREMAKNVAFALGQWPTDVLVSLLYLCYSNTSNN